MKWHEREHAFQCRGCEEWIELRKRREYEDAEFVVYMREMLLADHAECWKFNDPKMAADARRFRKEKTRRGNLAAQRVSWWRGR